MRRIRTRRRIKLILTLSLIASFILFFESRLESFAPQVKSLAETATEEAFDNKFSVTIGRIDGGIFYPITLNNCVFTDREGKEALRYFRIKSIVSNYRIWDFMLKPRKRPRVDFNFYSQNDVLSGFIRFEGFSDDASVKGFLKLYDAKVLDFKGRFYNGSFTLDLRPKQGGISAYGNISEEDNLVANLKISHAKLGNFDIACEAVLRNKFKDDSIEGEVETKNLMLNYKNFSDIKVSYIISEGYLDILNLDIGGHFKLRGKAGLKKPNLIDIALFVNNANIGRLISDFGAEEEIEISGVMNGKFEFKGPLNNLKTNASFDMKEGYMGKVDFNYLTVSLKGDGPIVTIQESRITREGGHFELTGYLDFRKFGKGNIFDGIKLLGSDTAILWDKMEIQKMKGFDEVVMQKRFGEDIGVGVKRALSDEKVDESLRDKDEYQLQYNLNPHQSLKLKVGEDTDFFGLEHRDKF